MRYPIASTLLMLSILFVGCETKKGSSSSQEPAPNTKQTPPQAREVNRYEFVEIELVSHPDDETNFNHFYMGSLDGFDYFSVRNNRYKIPTDQLSLGRNFPLTEENSKWIPMRIHFSHVKEKSQ